MKKGALLLLSFGCLAVLPLCCAFSETLEVSSTIGEVTVYPDAAVISRIAGVKLDAGQQQVVFTGIIPEVDDNSLRVSGSGSAAVKILGAQVKREYLTDEPAAKVRQLQDEIQKLQDDRRVLEDTKKVLSE